jgi:hypothetical protein
VGVGEGEVEGEGERKEAVTATRCAHNMIPEFCAICLEGVIKPERNVDCPDYEFCLEEAAKTNRRSINCSGCTKMSNNLKPEKKVAVKAELLAGNSLRGTVATTGVAKNTVSLIKKELSLTETEIPLCECGQPATHKGWCQYRIERSPRRKAYLKNLNTAKETVSFDELAQKECENLTERQNVLEKEITDRIRELVGLQDRQYQLEEYLNAVDQAKKKTDKELLETYYQIFSQVFE